jgi:hypothetical protein
MSRGDPLGRPYPMGRPYLRDPIDLSMPSDDMGYCSNSMMTVKAWTWFSTIMNSSQLITHQMAAVFNIHIP